MKQFRMHSATGGATGATASPVADIVFESYGSSVRSAMEEAGAAQVLSGRRAVLLKPNLVNASAPPVTTPPAFCRAVIEYVRSVTPEARIVIAEGSGDPRLETGQIFGMLGYRDLAEETGVDLLDLNHAPLVERPTPGHKVFAYMHLPDIAFSHCVISLPVLKRHSLAGITGSLKNMMGFAPPSHYSGQGGVWKKAVFHLHMQESIRDLNRHIVPDFTVMDASMGMMEYHLGGRAEPVNRILASADAYALDRRAAELLDIDPDTVPHLRQPHMPAASG